MLSDLIHGHYHSRGRLFYFGNIFVTICELVIFFLLKDFTFLVDKEAALMVANSSKIFSQ